MCRLSASSIDQNDQSKGKEARHLFVYLLEDGSHSFGHIHENLQGRWCCRHQGNEPCSKRECSAKVLNGKTGIVNKQVNGKILANRINVCIEHIMQPTSWDSFLKYVKENDQKKKEAKEKGTWVHPKCQPAPPREAHFVRTNGKDPNCWSPSPINSWPDGCKNKDLDCKKQKKKNKTLREDNIARQVIDHWSGKMGENDCKCGVKTPFCYMTWDPWDLICTETQIQSLLCIRH